MQEVKGHGGISNFDLDTGDVYRIERFAAESDWDEEQQGRVGLLVLIEIENVANIDCKIEGRRGDQRSVSAVTSSDALTCTVMRHIH